MKVSSRMRALKIPRAVNTPNVRIVATSKMTRERKPRPATIPAASMAGPTRTSDSTTACPLVSRAAAAPARRPRRWYSS